MIHLLVILAQFFLPRSPCSPSQSLRRRKKSNCRSSSMNCRLSASASMQEDTGGHLFQNEWKVDGSGFLMGRRRLTARGGFKQKHLRNISLPLPPVHV